MSTGVITDFDSEGATEDVDGNEPTPLLRNGTVETLRSGASFTCSIFNLMNAIMGSGILALAYAMSHTGIVGFCILLVLVATQAAYSIHLLLKLCDQTGICTYEDLGGRALQKPGKILVGSTILIQNIGAMSSYLFILKLELPTAIRGLLSPDDPGALTAWYTDGKMVLILVTLCVILPLALLPKIGFLAYPSSITFFSMLYFTVMVVVKKWSVPCPLNSTISQYSYQISNSSHSDCTPKLFKVSWKSSYAMPIMAFSFLCHTAVLPIYCELDRPTKSRMQTVANVSISLSFLVYLLSALFAYFTFYGAVHSDVLLNYGAFIPRDIMVMTVRLAILLSVLLTVPIIHFPTRKAVTVLLRGARPFSWLFHIMATLIIVGVVLLLAIFIPHINRVYGVVGSTTSTCLVFVYPGFFYLKLSNEPLRSLESIRAMALLVFGLIMGVGSFSVIIYTWVLLRNSVPTPA